MYQMVTSIFTLNWCYRDGNLKQSFRCSIDIENHFMNFQNKIWLRWIFDNINNRSDQMSLFFENHTDRSYFLCPKKSAEISARVEQVFFKKYSRTIILQYLDRTNKFLTFFELFCSQKKNGNLFVRYYFLFRDRSHLRAGFTFCPVKIK